MASSSAVVKVTCLVLLCMAVCGPLAANAAVSCGLVAQKVGPCIGYLRGGPLPPGCCPGVKALAAAASTPADRRTACNCLKSTAGSIRGINYARAAGLPGLCRVNVPYQISPSTDCNRVN